MYHWAVRRRTRAMFDRLSRGDPGPIVAGLAEGVDHSFPGEHPLGGTRHSPAAGDPYVNEGTQRTHIRWGKVTYFHAYLDTHRLAEACTCMAAAGVDEAAAGPIVD